MRSLLAFLLIVLITLTPMMGRADELTLLEESAVKDRFVSNPRTLRDIGDPFVLAEEDAYYVYATGGPIGFFVWRSTDLVTFEKKKALKKVNWAASDYWAPEVYRVEDRYVMLFTARWRENGSLRTGIAFADSPEGPFEDPLDRPLMDYGYATIDATLTWDDEGNPYMIYVRDCSENSINGRQESHIYGVKLADDLLSTEGEPVLLLQPEGEWETKSGDTRWNEGPIVVKHDGRYYLYYSVNGYWMKEYSVSVAVADDPLGPYTKQTSNPLLKYVENEKGVIISGPGHNAFFTVGGELFTAYHTHTYPLAPSGNRQLCIDRAGFHADGTAYINGPTLAPQLRPLKELGLINHMAAAKSADEKAGLLTDGDTCVSPASSAYAWEGETITFIWPESVRSDMIMICPADGAAISGTVTLNGSMTGVFSHEKAAQPGESIILPFEPLMVDTLTVTFDTSARVGEILLLGQD